MPSLVSLPRLVLLSSQRFGSDVLTGPVGIPSSPVDPRYLDAYDETDRRVGLALFDSAYRRQALTNLSVSLPSEGFAVHAPAGSVAALAS
jgi:hypothetical protein